MEAHAADLKAAPVPVLALADREQLRASLKPHMTKPVFASWLWRARKEHGFPDPIRTLSRQVSWLVSDVQAWLASRPRGGTFAGRRPDRSARQ